MNLFAPAPDWKHATMAERVDACGSMLFLHGYITASQRSKVTLRLEKQLAQAIEARSAKTEGPGPKGESAVPTEGRDAP